MNMMPIDPALHAMAKRLASSHNRLRASEIYRAGIAMRRRGGIDADIERALDIVCHVADTLGQSFNEALAYTGAVMDEQREESGA